MRGLKGLLGLEGFLCEQSRSSSALQRMGSGLPPRLDRTLVINDENVDCQDFDHNYDDCDDCDDCDDYEDYDCSVVPPVFLLV